MPGFGVLELAIILAIVIVLFGASRIPQLLGGMGRGIKEFRQAARDDEPTPTTDVPAPKAEARPRDVI